MGATQIYDDPSYIREVWGIFGAGVFILAVRHFVRLRTAGLRRYQGDDYTSIFVLACHIIDATTVTIIYYKGSNVDYIGKSLDHFTHAQMQDIVYGSKMEKLAWYSYTGLIWGLKACLLFFYNRITFGLTQQMFVKVLAVVVAVTYAAMLLTMSLSCRPFRWNWQVTPLPPDNCMVRRQDFIVCTTLNTITDAMILSVPLPILWKLRIPLKKKIPIGILLCSGIFVITAAIVRVVMTLGSHPSALVINRWGMRETLAGITAVNAPVLKPLFTASFWRNGCSCSTSSSSRSHATPDERGNSGSNGTSNTGKSTISKLSTIFKRPEAVELVDMTTNRTVTDVTRNESEATTGTYDVAHCDFHQQPNESQDLIIQLPPPVARRGDVDIERGHPHPGVRMDAALGIVNHGYAAEEEHRTRERAGTLPTPAPDEYAHYHRHRRQSGRVMRIARSNSVS